MKNKSISPLYLPVIGYWDTGGCLINNLNLKEIL